jgi:hypothetical protein
MGNGVDGVQGLYCDCHSIYGGHAMVRTHQIEFERAVAVMHGSSPWMLGEEEGLFGVLNNRSPRRQSNRCCQVARSGSDSDLSSAKSEFMRKRNPNECRKLIWQRIMRLLMPFRGRRREGRRYHGGEMVDGEWRYSMLPF